MIFEPEPGTSVQLRDETIEFVSLEPSGPASVFVYAESGREGTVYKVLKGSEYYALKVFYPEYRDRRLLENTEKLSRFRHLEGFRVAERTVLTQDTFPDVIEKYPDLNFAVLMPWIEGTLWGNLMMQNDQLLPREEYFTIAQALIRSVRNLEFQGVAHCDLSNNNFIIDKTHTAIQLIDIEDMYAPDMPRPIPDVSYGTAGYRTKWIAQNGLWGPEADRFASAILCSEIITWHQQEIRENKAGDSSFFEEEEIGQQSERYSLMVKNLCDVDKELSILFDGAWFAENLSDCPAASDWMSSLAKLGETGGQAIVESEFHQFLRGPEAPTLIHFKIKVDTESANTPEISAEPASAMEVESEAAPPDQEEAVQEDQNETSLTADFVEVESQTVPEDVENYPAADSNEIEPEVVEPPQEMAPEENPSISENPDATIIARGVPPRMQIDLEILDFGVLNSQGSSLQLHISNSGGAALEGTIQAEAWIDVSPKEFRILPGEQLVIAVAANARFPRPKSGYEYRTANALTIESNISSEVIGARFRIAKPAFYESGWKRALLAVTLGSIFGCLISALSGFNPVSLIVLPVTVILFGFAGITSVPRLSSIAFSLVGFVLAEIFMVLLLVIFDGLQDFAVPLLGLGASLGLFGGALLSRIFSKSFHRRGA